MKFLRMLINYHDYCIQYDSHYFSGSTYEFIIKALETHLQPNKIYRIEDAFGLYKPKKTVDKRLSKLSGAITIE
ncbi:hypothetical protein BGP_4170 [Beggiatoa sp. PS]|nr:hypothetical protein BGP_4170 [Beggiatoa sp. PS]